MKCKEKRSYDCFYLTKDNVEEFKKWIKEKSFNNYCYFREYYNYLAMSTYDPQNIIYDEDYDYYEVECYYNNWIIAANNGGSALAILDDKTFKEYYYLIEE